MTTETSYPEAIKIKCVTRYTVTCDEFSGMKIVIDAEDFESARRKFHDFLNTLSMRGTTDVLIDH